MRLIFMGTPEFACPALAEILGQGHDVAAVYTRPPKPAGRRGLSRLPSPVQALADRRGLTVLTPTSLRSPEAAEQFRAHGADVAVVVAYGLLLPPAILAAPVHGCLNLHASLLPRWRGAAPIQRAVMAGDARTGVYVMQMEEGLDTGPVVEPPAVVAIGENETAGELHDRLAPIGAHRLVEALEALARGELVFSPQANDGAVYARKIEKGERRIDWTLPAKQVHDSIRGLSPFPGAVFEIDLGRGREEIKVLRTQTTIGEGEPGRVLDSKLTVACGSEAVQLLELQRSGRDRLDAIAFLRGAPIAPGAVLR
jgi:methionyl-tRNA formyltransferase